MGRRSVHEELESLTAAGMTTVQALYAATPAPAQRLNNDAGVIDAGRRPDASAEMVRFFLQQGKAGK